MPAVARVDRIGGILGGNEIVDRAVYRGTTINAVTTSGPLVFLLLVWAANRFIGVPRSRLARGAAALLAIVVIGQFVCSAVWARARWTHRHDYRCGGERR